VSPEPNGFGSASAATAACAYAQKGKIVYEAKLE
jgi:hypothetical protein